MVAIMVAIAIDSVISIRITIPRIKNCIIFVVGRITGYRCLNNITSYFL